MWILGEYCSGVGLIFRFVTAVKKSVGVLPIYDYEAKAAAGEEEETTKEEGKGEKVGYYAVV